MLSKRIVAILKKDAKRQKYWEMVHAVLETILKCELEMKPYRENTYNYKCNRGGKTDACTKMER